MSVEVRDRPDGALGAAGYTKGEARTNQHPRAIPAILASAVALGLLTVPAAAAPTKLTDAQMDKVTAGVHPRLRSRAEHLLPTTTALPARAYQERRAVRRVRRRRPHRAAALVLPLLAAAAGPAAARDPPPVRSLLELQQDRVVIQQWDNSCGAAALTTVLRPAGQTHARHINSISSLFHPFRLRQGPSTNCGAGALASDPRAPGYDDWHFGQWR